MSEAEQSLNDLVKEFRTFNERISSNANSTNNQSKTGPSFDASANKIVAALNILNNSVLASSKSTNAGNKKRDTSLTDFNKAIDKSIKKIEESNKKESEKIKKTEESIALQKELAKLENVTLEEKKKRLEEEKRIAEENKKLRRESATAKFAEKRAASKEKLKEQIKESKSISENIDALDLFGVKTFKGAVATEILTKTVSTSIDALTSYTKAIYNGQRGMEVAAKGANAPINAVADGLGSLLSTLSFFVPGGLLIKGLTALGGILLPKLTKAFTDVSEAAAKQLDVTYKTFNELSTVGATTTEGLEGVRDAAHQMGYASSQFNEYAKLITGNSKDIKQFGGTVAEGGKKLGKVFDGIYNSPMGRELENLGVTLDEQRESTLAYMAIQSKSGQLMKMNDKQLIDGTAAFVKELDEAATLTGTTRKEQLEGRKNAQAEGQFRAAQRVAERNGDENTKATLDVFSRAAAMVRPFDPEGATGILRFASGGWSGGDTAVAAAYQYGLENLKPGMTEAQIAQTMKSGVDKNQSQFDVTNQYMQKIGGVQTNTVGAADFSQNIGTSMDEAKKQGLTLEAYTKKQQEEKEKGSPTLKNVIDTNRAQQSTAINLDRAVNFFDSSTKLYAKAAKVFSDSVEDLVDMADSKTNPWGSKRQRRSADGGGGGASGGASGFSGGGGNQVSQSSRPTFESTGGGAAFGNPKISNQARNSGAAQIGDASQYSGSGDGAPKTDKTGKLLDFIGQLEGKGNYNILFGGKTDPNLTQMSIAQVLQMQSGMSGESTAAGKYQIIKGTLLGLLKQGVVSPTDIFNAGTQDKLATALMKQRGLDSYYAGKLSPDRFADNLAKEWASLPMSNGASYYAGVGSNKSLTSRNDIMGILSARTGWDGVLDGPDSGYKPNIELHGQEQVTITPASDKSNEIMISLLESMLGKYDTIINLLDDGNSHSKKLVNAMA